MIRVAHIGDVHLTSGPRFADTRHVLDQIVEDGRRQGVQIWVVPGDLSGCVVPHIATVEERNGLDEAFQAMAETGPVVIVCGNHDDAGDLAGYARLSGPHPIIVALRNETHDLMSGRDNVIIHCIPYPHEASLVDVVIGTSIRAGHQAAGDTLRQQLILWTQARIETGPIVILAGHFNVAGSKIAGDEIMAMKEVELQHADLEAFAPDLLALNHIHLHQAITDRGGYAGSISAQSHGETDEKVYVIADVERGALPIIHKRRTAARRLTTVDLSWTPETGFTGLNGHVIANAEVRVRVDIPEEHRAACPLGEIDDLLKAAGAHAVIIKAQVTQTVRAQRSDAMATARTTPERLAAYWDTLSGESAVSPDQRERCLRAYAGLPSEEPPPSMTVGDALELEKLVCRGVCNALPDEVSIDFAAMGPGVIAFIGPNGSGKSHLLELSGPATCHNKYSHYGVSFLKHVPKGSVGASELTFRSAGHQYRAVLKADPQFSGPATGKTSGWLYRDGVCLTKSGLIGDYTRAIEAVVPPLDVLQTSAFSAQGNVGSIFKKSKAERKDLVIYLLRLSFLQTQAEDARARAGAALERLTTIRAHLTAAQGEATRRAELLAELATAQQALVDERMSLGGAEGVHQLAATALAEAATAERDARANLLRLEEERARLTTALEEAQEAHTKAQAAVDDVRERIIERPAIEAAAALVAELEPQIRDALGAEREANEQLRPLETALASTSEAMAMASAEQGRLTRERDLASTAASRAGSIPALAARVTELEAEAVTLQAAATKGERLIAEAEKEVDAAAIITSQIDVLKAQIGTIEPRAKKHTEHIDCWHGGHEHPCPTGADARQAREQLATLRSQLDALVMPTNVPDVKRLRERLKERRDQLTTNHELAGRTRTDIARLDSDKVTAATLPTIIQDLGAATTRLAGLTDARQKAKDAIAEARSAVAILTSAHAALEKQRAKAAPLTARLAEITALGAQLDMKVAHLSELDLARVAARLAVERAPALPDLSALEESLEHAQHLESELAEQRDRCADAVTSAMTAVARVEGALGNIGDPDTAVAALSEQEALTMTEAADWRVLERSLGRDGVQALALENAGPGISAICNELLRSCFDSRFTVSLETTAEKADGKGVKEVFDIRIFDSVAGAHIEQGSGGEMVILTEAVRMGIAIWNVQQSGCQLRTLWRDESAEGLEAETANQYVTMLRHARVLGGFHQVIFVSHQEVIWRQADAYAYIADGRVSCGTAPLPQNLVEHHSLMGGGGVEGTPPARHPEEALLC